MKENDIQEIKLKI